MDDLLSGAKDEESRERQISAVQEVLLRGGFNLKFIVQSGDKPSEKTSSDGESMKLLGYKWDPEKDELSPGLGELNLNKKKRGEKKPNLEPVRTVMDAERLLTNILLTRSLIVGKISEFFDPCGFFKPVKLQMKLLTGSLKGKECKEILPEEDQIMWREILKEYVDLPGITIPKFCLPSDKISLSKIRLIFLADAAEFAGGAAVYAGKEISPGVWTCFILAAKSKIMKETITRNELSAILLCVELAFMVKSALTSEIGEVIYVTDSTIALSWSSNQKIKLRLFVYNRVMTILRLFEWTTESKENLLLRVDGNLNLADLLTKKHEIKVEHVSKGSEWIEGLSWMRKDISEMPLMSYDDLYLEKPVEESVLVECFPESFMKKFTCAGDHEDSEETDEADDGNEEFSVLAANAGKGIAELLVDPVFQGWRRALRITGYMQEWKTKYCHKIHLIPDDECRICKLGQYKWDPRNETKKWDTLGFSRISNTLDNLPIARGDTSNESALGNDIITPNRLKLGRNNSRSLEGNGIYLEMGSNFTKILVRNRSIYQQWYQTVIDNVHLLNLRLNKWLRSSWLPIINDIVLFMFNDSNYVKESICWKLGKVVDVQGNKVEIFHENQR